MDTRLLKVFQAIAEDGGMTKAARRLHVTASALSHSLSALESDLGTRLFDREGGRLRLNQAGEQLLAQIQAPLQALESAATAIRNLGQWGQGRLRIGSAITACQHLLPRVLQELRVKFPKLLLEVRTGDTPHLVEWLRDRQIDLALGVEPEPAPDLHILGLFEDELLLATAAGHRWSDGRPISDQDLAREPLIVYRRTSRTHAMLDAYLRERAITPATILEIESVTAIKELVKLNLGVAVLAPWVINEELVKGFIRMRPLGTRALRRKWAVYHLARRTRTLPGETFYALCRRQAASMRLDRKDLPNRARESQ